MRLWSLRAVRCFTRVFLHAKTTVDAGDIPDEPRLFWLREKPEDPQFEPHAGIKVAHVWDLPCISMIRA